MTSSSRTYAIEAIPGDGIGQETLPAAIRCVDRLALKHGFTVEWRDRDWGSQWYRRTGSMMPSDALDTMSTADAILLGAVGAPGIPDDVTLWGLLIPIRRTFDQYVNLRPIRVLPGVRSPLGDRADLDLLIVRENVEGEYSTIGGRFSRGTTDEFAIQEAVFTRGGIQRITRYAAGAAAGRKGILMSATKSNGIIHSMPFWDEVVAQTVKEHEPSVVLSSMLIDALAAELVLKPERLDVIVASNLFGDILSDLAAALAGSIGVAPSANLNPERRYPSLFEPVHGSAPDIAGQGIANPVAQIWSAAMMLDHLGEPVASSDLQDAFAAVLSSDTKTRDLGGTATTEEFTDAVLAQLDTAS